MTEAFSETERVYNHGMVRDFILCCNLKCSAFLCKGMPALGIPTSNNYDRHDSPL